MLRFKDDSSFDSQRRVLPATTRPGLIASGAATTGRYSTTYSIFCCILFISLVFPFRVDAAEGSNKPSSSIEKSYPPSISSEGALVVSEKRGLLSLNAVNAELGQVLAELSKASAVDLKLVNQAGAKIKVTVSFQGLTVQDAVDKIIATLPGGGFASAGKGKGAKQEILIVTGKGTSLSGQDAHSAEQANREKNKEVLAKIRALLLNLDDLIDLIKKAGGQDDTCEETYFLLSALNLGALDWFYKTTNFGKLLDTARNPKLSTCTRMASLELFMAKISKGELQKRSLEIQGYFKDDKVPDKLIARLTQLFAEKDVAPTLLISTILESSRRGQAARSHAWYAAGKTQTHTSHLLDLAMQDANTMDTAQVISGKMALEYLTSSSQTAIPSAEASKLRDAVSQAVDRAIALPNDSGLNELGRSMSAISAIPRFFSKPDVVPSLGQVIVKATNDDVKLTAIDVLLTIQTDYASEVAAQAKKVTDNLESIFTDEVSRERAKARLNMLGRK